MNLSNLDGQTARNKPSELFKHLQGLQCILSPPNVEVSPPSANTSPKLREKPTQETEGLLGQLAAATQPPTPKSQANVSRASTPESMGSNKTRPQTGGKAPRVQPTKPYANKEVEVTSEDDSSSDAGLSSGDEIPCAQPQPQPKTTKAKSPKLVQQTLISSSKKQKLKHLATVEDDTATTLHFSGQNMFTKEQMGELVENAFLKHVAEKADEKPKRGRKPGPQAKKGKTSPMFDQAGKESSAASSEQKGTPLFMNGPLIFFV